MEYFNGDYFCSKPIDNPGAIYECRHIISIENIPSNTPVEDISKAKQVRTPEWNSCVQKIKKPAPDGGWPDIVATLNQETIDWLKENVPDSTDKRRSDMPQGWMIYDPMLSIESISVSIFFLRQVDAMAFKLRWS